MQKYPQTLINVPIDGAADAVLEAPAVRSIVDQVEAELAETGRVLLRPSGTEPLVRVMVEGRDLGQIEAAAKRIAGVIRGALGASG
jgi:phosphoglucosamine mutase